MAVGEHDILAFAVDLPVFRDVGAGRAADAILRVIVLVRVLPAVSPLRTKAEGNKIAVPLTAAKVLAATYAALQPLK